ncbi:MAG: NAD-dependent epimerase/dehydratase family protein [bacterium]
MTKKRVVITGGAGFIGSHTVDEFLNHGYEVVVIDNLRPNFKENLQHVIHRIEFINGDIRDEKLLASVFKEGDIIVHLAGFVSVPQSFNHPAVAYDVNVSGGHKVYMAAIHAKAKRVVSASSASVYGKPKSKVIREDHPTSALSPYALHKIQIEEYGKLYSSAFEIESVAMRFFNVYGPRQFPAGDYSAVVRSFMDKAYSNQQPVINGKGDTVRDFIYVKDVARALRLASEIKMDKNKKHEVFNIATGKPTTIKRLWLTICEVMNKKIKPTYGPTRVGDIKVSLADVSKARKFLKFEATTSLVDGLSTFLK